MTHYFAYGSNCDINRLRERRIEPTEGFLGRIPGQLAFNKRTAGKRMGYAHVVPRAHTRDPSWGWVYGIIWSIDDSDLEKLDRFEGYPRHYYRTLEKVEVMGDCTEVEVVTGFTGCHIYHASPDMLGPRPRLPGQKYLHRIISGLQAESAPLEYLVMLHQWDEISWKDPATDTGYRRCPNCRQAVMDFGFHQIGELRNELSPEDIHEPGVFECTPWYRDFQWASG